MGIFSKKDKNTSTIVTVGRIGIHAPEGTNIHGINLEKASETIAYVANAQHNVFAILARVYHSSTPRQNKIIDFYTQVKEERKNTPNGVSTPIFFVANNGASRENETKDKLGLESPDKLFYNGVNFELYSALDQALEDFSKKS